MKIRKSLLISLIFIAILTFPLIEANPKGLATRTMESSPVEPEIKETQPSQEQLPTVSQEPPSNKMLEMLQSYVPKEKVDPAIEAEITKGASDVKVIVFYDLILKGEVLSSLPPSVKVGSDFEGALPFLSLKVPADMEIVQEVAEIAGVKGVYHDKMLYPEWITDEQMANVGGPDFESPYEGEPPFLLNQTTELVGASDLWNLGYTGKKVVIAVTDTGINKYHPDFYFPDTGENKVIFEYVSVDEDFNGVPDVGPEDIVGHGTHVASTAAGTGRTGGADFLYDPTIGSYRTVYLEPGTEKGVAPDAYLMNIKISHGGTAWTSWMMEGYVQAVLHGADVISTSFGGHYEFPEWDFPFIYTVEWATQNGVVVVVAAGNEGPDFGSIASAGHSDSVITVGATTKLDRVAWWSSRGPSTPLAIFGTSFLPYATTQLPWTVNATAAGALKTKPDIVAPGVRISAAYAHFTQTEEAYVQEGAPAEGLMYMTISGTSMATPHVAGAAALLLQAFRGAVPASVKAGFLEGADDLGLDPNVQGMGRLNVTRAYEIMNAATKVSSSIEAPVEDIPAEAPEYGPYPYFTGTDILVDDLVSSSSSFSNYLSTLEADNASLYYTSSELYDPLTERDGFDVTRIDSPHGYTTMCDHLWLVEAPGARSLRLHFSKVRLADANDYVIVYDKYGTVRAFLNGPTITFNWFPPPVPGDQAFIRLTANIASEPIYRDVDGSNTVSVNDVRVSTAVWVSLQYRSGSIVVAGDGDIGIPLTSFRTPPLPVPLERHRENVATNGVFDPGEYIYRDWDASRTVSAGDWRVTAAESPTRGLTFVAGPADPDFGRTLVDFATNEKYVDFWANGLFDDTVQDRGLEWGFEMDGFDWYDMPDARRFVYSTSLSNPTYTDPRTPTNIVPAIESYHNYIDRLGIMPTVIESPHDPYPDNYLYEWSLTQSGATGMSIHFTQIGLEPNRDFVRVFDKDYNLIQEFTGTWGSFWLGPILGDTVIIQMETDEKVGTYYGFQVDQFRWYVTQNMAFVLPDGARARLHFERIALAVGDTLTLSDTEGNAQTYTGPMDISDVWTAVEFRGDGCTLNVSITLTPNGDGVEAWGFKINQYEAVKYDLVFYEEGAGLILLHFDKIRLEPGDFIEIKANGTTPILYWRSPSGFVSDDFWLPIPQLGAGGGWSFTGRRTGGFLKIAIITDDDGNKDQGYVIDRYAVWYEYPSAHMLSNYDAFLMLETTDEALDNYQMKYYPNEWLGIAGTALGVRGDDVGIWYDLPFNFTFYGEEYDSVFVSSNGLLVDTANRDWSNTEDELKRMVAIAPMWDDLVTDIRPADDVYVAQLTPDSVYFRWSAVTYADWSRFVEFEVILCKDGRIKFNYGANNGGLTPTIGISAGDGKHYVLAHEGITVSNFIQSVLFLPPPFITKSALKDYVTTYGGNLLITGDWPDMIPKPDVEDPYEGYNYYTKDLGITWSDKVGGGYTTNIRTHQITTGVKTLYFGGPLASLIAGTGVTTAAYDPFLPGVCAKVQTGKVVAISDDDVLDDIYIANPMYESDNLRLGLNIIAWFAGIDTATIDPKQTEKIHDVGLGVSYSVYIINGTSTTIDMNVHNFGNFSETAYAWLQIYDSEFALTYNKTLSASGIGAGTTKTIAFTVPAANISCREGLYADTVYVWGMVSLWANFTFPFGDDWIINNWWPWWLGVTSINIIVKNPRTGVNPILSTMEPKSLDSYTSPFVAAFPGDWKPLNVTFVTSGNLVNGTMQITGTVADIADFYQYDSATEMFEPVGDRINITLKDMSWWQHTTTTTLTNSPSSDTGQWNWGSDACTSDDWYADTSTPNAQHIYGNYGFNWRPGVSGIPPDAVITKVEVGIEALTWGDERIGLYVSWNGGTTWSSEQISDTLPWYDYDNVTWFDFTLATHWTPAKLYNANFGVRVEHEVVGDASQTYLDWLPVRVTYTSSVWLSLYYYSGTWALLYPPHIVPSLTTTGHAFGYMEIRIPEDAEPGTYTGTVTVYDGTTALESMPINIEVKEPKSKLLYDDIGHYAMMLYTLIYIYAGGPPVTPYDFDYKFLWNSYYDAWVKAAKWGFDIDSLVFTLHSMKLDLEETFKKELPWRWEKIIAAKFEETFSPYTAILEFNNKNLYDPEEWWIYFRNLDSGLYPRDTLGYVYYTLEDLYDLILKAGGNLVMLADDLCYESYWDVLYWLTGNDQLGYIGDIQVSDTQMFNWTVTRDHMEDFPHWITHDVENFTMAGWCWPGYAYAPLDWGGYFLYMPEKGTTAALTNIESPHPYPNNYANEWSITVPSAEAIWVHVKRADIESEYRATYKYEYREGYWWLYHWTPAGWVYAEDYEYEYAYEYEYDFGKGDWLRVYDNNHTLVTAYTGNFEDEWIEVPGNTTYITLNTDGDLAFWGFQIDMYQYVSEEGVQVLSMGTQKIEWFDSWEWRWKEGWQWGPIMAIDEHLTGLSPTTELPYLDSKVFVLGEANQFENLFLEYQDWLTCDITSLTAGYEEPEIWTTDTLLHNILAYMSDKTAPTSTLAYSGPSYVSGGLYVNGSTAFTIIASDALTDIAATYYRIDEEEWTTYTGPFNLNARDDGDHTIHYYSIDSVGNTEPENSLAVYLDNTPPNLEITSTEVTPGLITSSITVSWAVSDNGSGVDHVQVRIDNETYISRPKNETSYTFGNLGDGAHTVYLRAVDNLGQIGAVNATGEIVDEISSRIAVQSYWPYLVGGIVVIAIIVAAALYRRRKKPELTS